MRPIQHTNINQGNPSIYYTYVPVICYSWTTDANNNSLTGKEEEYTYVYYAYKIIKNEKGKYEAVKSDDVKDFDLLSKEYDYVSQEFFKVVIKDNIKCEDDYENENYKELTDEQMEEYSSEIEELKKQNKLTKQNIL